MQKVQPGYMVFAPITGRFASSMPTDVGSWRRLGARERPKPGEVVRSKMVGARPAYVWDVSQTAGDPIPELPVPELLEGQAPAGLWDGLAAQIKALGFTVLRVAHEDQFGGADGRTIFPTRQVLVRTNFAEANQVTTLAHEMAHVVMHDPNAPGARQHRAIREVEAESVAMICAEHGMDTRRNTIPHVARWATTVKDVDPLELVEAAGERVRKVATGILDQLDTAQAGDGTPPSLEQDAPGRQRASLERTASRSGSIEPGRPNASLALAARGL